MSADLNTDVAQDLLSLVEESLEQAKKAYAELRQMQDAKIELEKVASESMPRFSQGAVNKTVRMLVQHNFLPAVEQEKFASQLVEHPENALKLVQRLLTISAPAHDEGRGVPKSASTKTTETTVEDNSAWSKVIKEGA